MGVKVGSQEWTDVNHNSALFANGETIPQATNGAEWANATTPLWCWPNFNSADGAVHGRRYNWYAVTDSRFVPAGWRLPSDNDWKELELRCRMPANEVDTTGLRGAAIGAFTGTYWADPIDWESYAMGLNPENHIGLSMLRGGYTQSNGTSSFFGTDVLYWSSTQDLSVTAFYRRLTSGNRGVTRGSVSKSSGLYVRFVKDYTPPTIISII